ncbi:glycoside hydrolase family protein [Pontibacter beigongshangensis]|uniref:hypothetical protein n=1 Tax=Pontibacter beigongshangensis TaxID=2574733 RepID=UPI00164F2B58|nr:hypothetical protein [Pontibacter beigongshangensis]
MKKIIILLVALVSNFSVALAQETTTEETPKTNKLSGSSSYRASVGLRLLFDGPTPAITGKYFLTQRDAVEFSVGFPEGGTFVEGLYQYHGTFADAPGLLWYGGAGLMGLFPSGIEESYLGLPFIIGLEYKPATVPLTFGFDWQPLIYLSSDIVDRFNARQFGLVIRVAIK